MHLPRIRPNINLQKLHTYKKTLLYNSQSEKVFGAVVGDLKYNLNINIPTKERISNLDIFLFYQKFTKIVLTAVAE